MDISARFERGAATPLQFFEKLLGCYSFTLQLTDEKHANNVSLASIIRAARLPAKVAAEEKRPEAVLASGR